MSAEETRAAHTAPGDDFGLLVAGAAKLGITLDDAQIAQFARFRTLLLEWNTRVNLTAITDPAEVVTRHFLDSLTCVMALPKVALGERLRLLDIGSGAGFPGLALAIALPLWNVTTLDSTGKKIRFQHAVIQALKLKNAETITGRAEDFAHHEEYHTSFDVVTARAVAALPTLLEYSAPYVCLGGYSVFLKKGDIASELAVGQRAASILGARLLRPLTVNVPPLDDGRVVIAAHQEKPCPPMYPRPHGAPTKHPLGS